MKLRHRFNSRHAFGIIYFACLFGFLMLNIALSGITETHAESQTFGTNATLIIPEIGLKTGVAKLSLEDGELKTPDNYAGSYSRSKNKTLIIGHRTTAFSGLDAANIGETIIYSGNLYRIISKTTVEKSSISMHALLKKSERDTLVLMTCAGKSLDNNDATHRLIITAVLE